MSMKELFVLLYSFIQNKYTSKAMSTKSMVHLWKTEYNRLQQNTIGYINYNPIRPPKSLLRLSGKD